MKKAISIFAAASAMLLAGVSAQAGTAAALKGPMHVVAPPKSDRGEETSGISVTVTTVGTGGFLPCFGCAGGEDVDLPYPVNAVEAGSSVISTVVLQSTFYIGSPTVVYSLEQGGTVLQTESVTFPFVVTPGELSLAYFPEPAPTTSGLATVVMKIYNGSTLLTSSSYKILIYQP